MLDAGAELVAFHAPEDELAAPFAAAFPQARRVADQRARSSRTTASASSSPPRSPPTAPRSAIAAMRHGKDVMSDKPGVISLEQLAEVRRVQAETGRIYSICYSEHFEQPADRARPASSSRPAPSARSCNTVGLGPHRLRKPTRGRTGSSSARAMAASSPTSPRTSASSSCSSPATARPRCCRPRSRNRANPRHAGPAGFRRHASSRTDRRHRL